MKITTFLLVVIVGTFPDGQDPATSITGTVKLQGNAPKQRPIQIACPKCAPLYPGGMPREDLVLDHENRIRGAFVYVKAGLEGKKFEVPKTPVVLDQKGCRYEPHMLGMMAGQTLVIRNSDPHAHCTHAIPFLNKEFNFGLPRQGQEAEKTFENPEVMIKIKDDVSVWMGAWVGVLSHPYFAITGPDGKYEIKGLPPGKYTIEVWQERCSPLTQEIDLGEKGAKTLDFALERKKE